jgi:F-type H+-transporting ATPase subunit gamma
MANLKEVRERITSVKSTQQITKAMKMVSAAKLRRAQQAIVQMRPYSNKLNEMLTNILSNLGSDANTSFGVEREVKKALVVVVTSNRGLCGAFNNNVIKSALATINDRFSAFADAGNVDIMPIGKKANDYFRKRFDAKNIRSEYVDLFSDLSFDNVGKVAQVLMDAFSNGEYDAITVSYGQFQNAVIQNPMTEQFLPVAKMESDGESSAKADYIFEPDKTSLLDYLVPSILKITFQKYLLDTHASEHGARMTAMDNATENAEELIRELKISYNKARQEAITKELSEIVGGAAAMESGS